MQYPNTTSEHKKPWYQQLIEYIFKKSTFFLHAGFFVGAALIGIARYALVVLPGGLTELMAVWSIVILLHGVIAWQRASSTESGVRNVGDGILKTVFFSSALNGIMWVMWTLASEARNAAPLHLTVLIALTAVIVSSLILGKRMLYTHWLKEFLRDNPAQFEEMKTKRGESLLDGLQLDDDGELSTYLDDTSSHRLEKR